MQIIYPNNTTTYIGTLRPSLKGGAFIMEGEKFLFIIRDTKGVKWFYGFKITLSELLISCLKIAGYWINASLIDHHAYQKKKIPKRLQLNLPWNIQSIVLIAFKKFTITFCLVTKCVLINRIPIFFFKLHSVAFFIYSKTRWLLTL